MKGILFKPYMIQAIIEGRKTQTRRVIKPQPSHDCNALVEKSGTWNMLWNKNPQGRFPHGLIECCELKPHYQVGEIVCIKEAMCFECYGEASPQLACYKETHNKDCDSAFWHSPFFMPEKYARYFITITDVRAERLQNMSEPDAVAEGIAEWQGMFREYDKPDDNPGWTRNPIRSFRTLWNSINKNYPWESNPFVWAYSFCLIDKQERVAKEIEDHELRKGERLSRRKRKGWRRIY